MALVGTYRALLSSTSLRAPSLYLDFLSMSASTFDPRITFSRGTNATLTDSTGRVTYAPANLLLNTATLSTQSVTTQAISYILSFQGTGSVALSGAFTGSLAGTGVNDRVFLKFTSTAASLTLTVTGTITSAQLEPVTYQTTPGPYVATTASAYYGPRFDYDPVTLAPRGLLIEEARTNSFTYSEQFDNAAWTKQNGATVTANTTTAPDGTTTADTLANTNGQPAPSIFQSVTLSNSVTYTVSYYLRAGTASTVLLGAFASGFLSATAQVLSGPGSVSGTTLITVSGLSSTQWTRVSLTFTGTGASTTLYIYPETAGTATGKNIIIWGAQLEAGSFATSYIPTVASTVTRNADNASMTGTNFSSWYNQSAGTLVVEYAGAFFSGVTNVLFGPNAVGGPGVADNDSSNNVRVGLRSVAYVDTGGFPTTTGVIYKTAFGFQQGDYGSSTNGGTVQTSNNATAPAATTAATLGSAFAGSNYLNSYLRRMTFYATRFPNSQLQALST